MHGKYFPCWQILLLELWISRVIMDPLADSLTMALLVHAVSLGQSCLARLISWAILSSISDNY